MHSRILEAEISNLRKRNAELMEDIALLRKSADSHSSKNSGLLAKEKSSFGTQGRESLIEQLELKTLEVLHFTLLLLFFIEHGISAFYLL